MKKQLTKVLLALLTLSSLVIIQPKQVTKAQTVNPNDYFNSLIARPDLFKAYSLRDQTQIDSVSVIKPNAWVTYDATMDAAKAVIPAFDPQTPGITLGAPVAVTDDRLTFPQPLTSSQQGWFNPPNRGILLDNEILTVNQPSGTGSQFADNYASVLVNRGQFGTTTAAHASGLSLAISRNSLIDYLNAPLGTSDGHTYLFTWDAYWDPSWLGSDITYAAVGQKFFQLTSGQRGGVWLESRVRTDGQDGLGNATLDRTTQVGLIDGRYYWGATGEIVGAPGSNITSDAPIKPQANRFVLYPGRWTRYWVFIDQRANDYSLMTMWVADSATPPVKIFDALTLKVQGTPPTIYSWWLEQNASYDLYRGSRRDLVSYVRNLVALQDISLTDVSPLLIQPGSSNIPPSVSLTSPTSGQTFTGPATVSIAANASDSDGSISKVEFYNGSTLLNTVTTSPYAYSWSNVAAGTYTITAKAYDNAGAVSSASASITVNSTATTLVGDLNGDHIVNSIDWSILNSKWFTSDATSDLNHDGLVNSLDWSLMNANWLKTA